MAAEEKSSLTTLVAIVAAALAGITGALHFGSSGRDVAPPAAAAKDDGRDADSKASAADDPPPGVRSAFGSIHQQLSIYRKPENAAAAKKSDETGGDDRLVIDVDLGLPLLGAEVTFTIPAQPLTEQRQMQRARQVELQKEIDSLATSNQNPRVKIDFLIATVPDPSQSHQQSVFDQNVAALQLAAQQFEYVIDRFELPWAPDDKSGDAKRKDDFHRRPGVLLFRKEQVEPKANDDERRFLVIFLVGELATSGVHKPALVDALEQIAAWNKHHKEPRFLAHIVGRPSLAALIR